MGSWKTTSAGILAALVAWGQAALYLIDSDPNTAANWDAAITATILAVGLFLAQDKGK